MKIKAFLFSVILFSLCSIYSHAQISLKYEYLGSSGYYLDKGDNPRKKIGDAKGSAMVYQGSVNIPISMKIDRNDKLVIWGIGLGGAYVSLNNKNFTENLVISEIMNIELGIYHMRTISDKWSLMASMGAGLYSSSTKLSQIRGKQILGNVSAVFIHHFSENFQLGGGIAINNTFGYPMIFPTVYLNWILPGRYDFMISMANGLEISAGLDINKYLKLSLIAEMNGQGALLEKDGKDVMFSHQYIVAGLRPQIKINDRISIPITAGINAFRPAYYSDRTLKAMFATDQDYYFQISPYVSAGLNIYF